MYGLFTTAHPDLIESSLAKCPAPDGMVAWRRVRRDGATSAERPLDSHGELRPVWHLAKLIRLFMGTHWFRAGNSPASSRTAAGPPAPYR
jgi:hypothetical protein